MNKLAGKSEILYIFDAKDTVPNGDPFTGEQRYDEVTQKAMVSDVRLKRYIRDFIDENYSEDDTKSGMRIFYSSIQELSRSGDRAVKIGTVTKEVKKKQVVDKDESLKKLLSECIDVRLFGVVVAGEKNSTTEYTGNLTGAVQFKFMNRSLNRVELQTVQNTTVMKSKEDNSQGSIATSSYVPYSIFSTVGYVNPNSAKRNGLTENDVEVMVKALWNEINTKNSRSKTGQNSRLLFKINYKDNISKIADLEAGIRVKNDTMKFRTFDDIKGELDFSKLEEMINRASSHIENIEVFIDENSFEKGFLNISGTEVIYKSIFGNEITEL
jgi:CRISPR-associated protein Csh2